MIVMSKKKYSDDTQGSDEVESSENKRRTVEALKVAMTTCEKFEKRLTTAEFYGKQKKGMQMVIRRPQAAHKEELSVFYK